MTDKQIIIDGVDVSGCEFFDECEVRLDWSNCLAHCSPYPEGACYDDCSEYPNCYYKQLKRKEQECEELKKFLNEIRDEELKHLDIEWDEYETSARKYDYSNIITLVERALGEIDD